MFTARELSGENIKTLYLQPIVISIIFYLSAMRYKKLPNKYFLPLHKRISLSYKTAIQNVNGSQFMANGNLYFPGFAKTHSIVLNGALLRKDSMNQISFSSGFPFSRGYQSVNFYQMYKWGVNYHLPIAFPDKGFGNIAYLASCKSQFIL